MLRLVSIVFDGVVLSSLGVVMVVSCGDPPIILLRDGFVGAVLVTGALLVLVPIWVCTTKDLSQAWAQHVRKSERVDIATHLYDSMLQTLILIRASAGDPVRVQAIALTEKHELRT